jgi:hypothetical protein
LLGSDRPAEPLREERRDLATAAGILVQPAVPEIGQDQGLDRRIVIGALGGRGTADQFEMLHRYSMILGAVDQKQRAVVTPCGGHRAGVLHRVVSGHEQDRGSEPGEGSGDRLRNVHVGHLEGLASNADQVGRSGHAHDGRDGRFARGGDDRARGAHRVPENAHGRNLGPGRKPADGGDGVVGELRNVDRQSLGRAVAVAAHVEHEAVEAGGVQVSDMGESAAAVRFPAMDDDDPGTGICGRSLSGPAPLWRRALRR